MTFKALSFPSPLGPLTLFEEDTTTGPALVALEFGKVDEVTVTPLLAEARTQIQDYFDGHRQTFDLPLAPAVGTDTSDFQRTVWQQMLSIPYGETRTYGNLDQALTAQGVASSPQAVGTACGANPLPVLIPCHRVLGAGGTLTGYSGGEGVETKRQLLILEGALLL